VTKTFVMYWAAFYTVVSLKHVVYFPVFLSRKILKELHSMQDAVLPHFTRLVRLCGLGVEDPYRWIGRGGPSHLPPLTPYLTACSFCGVVPKTKFVNQNRRTLDELNNSWHIICCDYS